MDSTQVSGALKWMTAGKAISQIVSWVVTLIVIRILSPADYGLFAMASVMVVLAERLMELGLGSALVQTPELDNVVLRQVFTLLILLNVFLYVAISASAPLLAQFFSDDSLELLIPVLALQFLITALETVPSALLARRFDFRSKAIIMTVGAASNSLVTLACALYGFGVWSLVFGSLAAAVGRLVGFGFIERFAYVPTFAFRGVRKLVAFGGFVTLSRFLNVMLTQSAFLIIGRLLGKEALGFFSIANQLATLPMQKLSGILNSVGLAAYSRIQDDMRKVSANYRKSIVILAFVIFPVFWGLSAIAVDFTEVVLGSKWQAAAVPLQLIALIAPFQMIFNTTTPALLGIGRAEVFFSNLVILNVSMPVFVLLGTHWGLNGAAAAWTLAYLPLFLVVQRRSLQRIGITLFQLSAAVWKSIVVSLAMMILVVVTNVLITSSGSASWITLVSSVTLGIVAYILGSALFNRATATSVVGFVRK